MESVYKIRAVTRDGVISEQVINANSPEEAANIIKSRNQIPIEIKEGGFGARASGSKGRKKKVKVSDLSVFCKQLSAMLNAGMPINKALDIQEKQTENLTLKNTLKEISNSIKKGEGLSKAMKQYPDIFPKILLSMIDAGEATGKLDEVLERMSVHYTKENAINNKVKGAMMYPIILGSLTVVVMVFMLVKIVPTFTSIFEGSGTPLPGVTKFVLGISGSVQKFWFIYGGVTVALVILLKNYIKTAEGKYKFDSIKMRFPLIAKPMQQIITARFTRTLSTLLESGIPIVNALMIAAETTNNVLVSDAISVASDGIKRGMSLTGEIRKTALFPLMMTSMVGIGEETGAMETLLAKTADYYDEELEAGIARLLSLVEPIMIIFMGVVVGVIVVAMMLPMLEMSSGVGI